jgi:hypothetical protein
MGKDWFKNNIQSVIFLLNSIFPNEMGWGLISGETIPWQMLCGRIFSLDYLDLQKTKVAPNLSPGVFSRKWRVPGKTDQTTISSATAKAKAAMLSKTLLR